jgi:hypothetical protein
MAQMDWFIQPPVGSAFYIGIDGTLRLRFDSSKVTEVTQWAIDSSKTFRSYLARHKASPIALAAEMPKTLDEINAYVKKLNEQLTAERAELSEAETQPSPVTMTQTEPEMTETEPEMTETMEDDSRVISYVPVVKPKLVTMRKPDPDDSMGSNT